MTSETTRTSNATRTAIVTGASRGLGLALARGLAGDGWSLVIDARDGQALERARAELAGVAEVGGTGGTVVSVQGDVTDGWHRAVLIDAARGLGGIDLVVNNAGVLGPSPRPVLADYPLDALDRVLAVNLAAPLGLTQAALPDLRARGGAVLAVTSDAAVVPYAGWGGYAAAKAGVEQLFAVLGAEEPDVRVWVADPGDLRTRMHQEAFPGEDITDRPLPESAVPALLRLIRLRLASGRYRAAGLGADLAGVPA